MIKIEKSKSKSTNKNRWKSLKNFLKISLSARCLARDACAPGGPPQKSGILVDHWFFCSSCNHWCLWRPSAWDVCCRYCSTKCREAARVYHRFECGVKVVGNSFEIVWNLSRIQWWHFLEGWGKTGRKQRQEEEISIELVSGWKTKDDQIFRSCNSSLSIVGQWPRFPLTSCWLAMIWQIRFDETRMWWWQ